MSYSARRLKQAKRNITSDLDLEEPSSESDLDVLVVKSPPPSRFIDLYTSDDKIVVPPSTSNKKPRKNDTSVAVSTKKADVIDLTKDASMADIRKEHSTYFSYDPRGKLVRHEEKELFCEDCTCPIEYCAEKVFGRICYNHVEHLIGSLGFEVIDTQLMVIQHFRRTYTELVHHKMMWNNISFRKFNKFRYVHIPDCLRLNSLQRIIDDHALWKERNLEVVSWGPDSNEDEDDESLNLKLPALNTVTSETEHETLESNANANIDQDKEETELRTAIEQGADVSPIFTTIKGLLSKKR
jgi:hypothetical protein